MEEVLRFLKTYDLWIYLLLGGAALLALRKLIISWQEWRASVFGLEKESAQRKIAAALSVFILLGLFGTAEFVMTSIIYPDFPNTQTLATPTLELLVTPTTTLSPLVAVTSTPQGGIPTVEVGSNEGCVAGQIDWSYPEGGDTLRGEVILSGTVSVPNLGFYKYEYSQSGSGLWVPIAAGDQTIIDQPLGGDGSGQWDTTQLVPGDYLLRLVVTDNVNNVFPACVVAVRIAAP